jgi:hypothetical protein
VDSEHENSFRRSLSGRAAEQQQQRRHEAGRAKAVCRGDRPMAVGLAVPFGDAECVDLGVQVRVVHGSPWC